MLMLRTLRQTLKIILGSLLVGGLSIPIVHAEGLAFTTLNDGLTLDDIAQILAGEGIEISNLNYIGDKNGVGTFTGGKDGRPEQGREGIGLKDGVILASNHIFNFDLDTGTNGDNINTEGDADLDVLSGKSTFDAAVLEFDFIPNSPIIFIQYVFGSEEYNEYVNTNFNDTFAFFVNGVNCATVGKAGEKVPVTINNINNGNPTGDPTATNPELYRDNTNDQFDTALDGLTVKLTCAAVVNVGEVNTMRLAIADASDHILDSAVFLDGSGLTTVLPTDADKTEFIFIDASGKGISSNLVEVKDIIVKSIYTNPADVPTEENDLNIPCDNFAKEDDPEGATITCKYIDVPYLYDPLTVTMLPIFLDDVSEVINLLEATSLDLKGVFPGEMAVDFEPVIASGVAENANQVVFNPVVIKEGVDNTNSPGNPRFITSYYTIPFDVEETSFKLLPNLSKVSGGRACTAKDFTVNVISLFSGGPIENASTELETVIQNADQDGKVVYQNFAQGIYELTVYAKDYVPQTRTVTLPCDGSETLDVVMPLENAIFQITATWSGETTNFDAHLSGPGPITKGGERYHVFFDHAIEPGVAELVEEYKNGIHSEQITVGGLRIGKYKFSVHHFKGDSTMANSDLSVLLNLPDGTKYTYTPPASATLQGEGDIWIAFEMEIDFRGGFHITPVNSYDYVDIFEYINYPF